MAIAYSFEIVAVDENARCMEVIYSAEGYATRRVGTRIPRLGENLNDVIEQHAPLRDWEEEAATLVAPEVGTKGTIAPVVESQEDQPINDLSEAIAAGKV